MNGQRLADYIKAQYPLQHRLVTEGGKLVDDWANVADHCFVEAAAMEVVAPFLGLDTPTMDRLARNAASENWDKRLLKRPEDFTDEEKNLARTYAQAAGIDEELRAALNPWFLPIVRRGEASFLQLVAFLVDDMTMGDQFVSFDQRVDEVSARNSNPDPDVDAVLGEPYWTAERAIGREVEKMFIAIFAAREVQIATPVGLVAHVNAELDRRFPD